MMDIKVNKVIKTNKIVEKAVVPAKQDVGLLPSKKKYNLLSSILFGFMTSSIALYIFMISSSVFYAVKMSQYTFKGGNITNSVSTSTIGEDIVSKGAADRISYINKDSDTSISLR